MLRDPKTPEEKAARLKQGLEKFRFARSHPAYHKKVRILPHPWAPKQFRKWFRKNVDCIGLVLMVEKNELTSKLEFRIVFEETGEPVFGNYGENDFIILEGPTRVIVK
jgi:hypothetical protein